MLRGIATFGLLSTAAAVFGLSHLGPSVSLPANCRSAFPGGNLRGLFDSPNDASVLGVSLAATFLAADLAHTVAEDLLSHACPDHALLGLYTAGKDMAFRVAAAFGLAGAILSDFRGPPITAPPAPDLSGKPAA